MVSIAFPKNKRGEARKMTQRNQFNDAKPLVTVPLSLKDHFERAGCQGFGDVELAFVDPTHPGHDYLDPDQDEPVASRWAVLSKGLLGSLRR
jgi:hypothetical protein